MILWPYGKSSAVVRRNGATIPLSRSGGCSIQPQPRIQLHRQRWLSTSNDKKKSSFGSSGAPLFGIPFSISPERALKKFETWARTEQGLGNFLMSWRHVTITAAYCPVWSFDLNLRYIVQDKNKPAGSSRSHKRFDWKPEIFRAYQSPVIFIPGLSAYAGHSYRRSLVDPLVNTALVFLGENVVPFGGWMLNDMKLGGTKLEVFPDPWNATKGRALGIVKEQLKNLPTEEERAQFNITLQTELLSARRVYMPTYIISYKIVGMVQFQAFVSGCDDGAAVSGISHKVFQQQGLSSQDVSRQATSILSCIASIARQGLRVLGGRNVGTLIVVALQLFASLMARLLFRIPIIGALGGAFVGFRKVIRPWMDNRWASAEWERQREHDASTIHDHVDDFVDRGGARRYFERNREQLLRSLSGEAEHSQGAYDWYKLWEEWARRQWEQQQKQQRYHGYEQQQQQQQQRRAHKKPGRQDYQWPFDANDPYAVLGIKRGATKNEVSAAFRKQMM